MDATTSAKITGFINETDAKAVEAEFENTPFAHVVEDIKEAKDVPFLTILFKDFH